MKVEIKCDGCGKFLEILDAEISSARFFLTVEKCKLCEQINIQRGADVVSELALDIKDRVRLELSKKQEKTDD